MGQTPELHVDPAAIDAVAGRFDSVAEAAAHAAVLPLHFGADSAGRGYVAAGSALREAVDVLRDDLHAWSRAASEIASGLRCGADRYVGAERGVVAGLG
jgi:hypothetical protein